MSRTVIGKVSSNKMNKTIVVNVERHEPHPKYGKIVRRFTKLFVHDDKNVCKIGDIVKVAEARPFSKNKSWVLVDVLKKVD